MSFSLKLFLCVRDEHSLNPKEFPKGMSTIYLMALTTVFTQKETLVF